MQSIIEELTLKTQQYQIVSIFIKKQCLSAMYEHMCL